jgi:hypothetical protein
MYLALLLGHKLEAAPEIQWIQVFLAHRMAKLEIFLDKVEEEPMEVDLAKG